MKKRYNIYGMAERLSFEGDVISRHSGRRLDLFLTELLGRTRSSVQKLIRDGYVKVNGQLVKAGHRLRPADTVEVYLPPEQQDTLLPQQIPLEVLYQDEYLIVVNKPPGLVMYPSFGHRDGTLMNAILYITGRVATVGGPLRPGVVHRLDRDTSGAVVVALDDRAYYGLVAQFKQRSITRHYLALVHGRMGRDSGVIDKPLGRSRTHRKKFSTLTSSPREAKTYWQVIEVFSEASLLKVTLATGRTHQIRVHMSSIGHPVLGDSLYGRKTSLTVGGRKVRIPRQMLHAETLGFRHPITGEPLIFHAPLFEDMKEVLELLRKEGG